MLTVWKMPAHFLNPATTLWYGRAASNKERYFAVAPRRYDMGSIVWGQLFGVKRPLFTGTPYKPPILREPVTFSCDGAPVGEGAFSLPCEHDGLSSQRLSLA